MKHIDWILCTQLAKAEETDILTLDSVLNTFASTVIRAAEQPTPIPLSKYTMFLSCGEQRSVRMLFKQLKTMPFGHSDTTSKTTVQQYNWNSCKKLISSLSVFPPCTVVHECLFQQGNVCVLLLWPVL